jgi:hypothetical protein
MYDLFSQDILKCVRALYGDPEHAQYLSFTPERHYADAGKTQRLYHDMCTGEWWWATQVRILCLSYSLAGSCLTVGSLGTIKTRGHNNFHHHLIRQDTYRSIPK